MKVLVVAAHPDDETLGCGGTIAKHTQAGDEVHVLIVASGITSREEQPLSVVELMAESVSALGELGVAKENVTYLSFPDQMLETIPRLKITKEIEKAVERVKPEIIYTHCYSDVNLDHQVVHEAVMVAARPVREHIRKVLCFETVSSTEWGEAPFKPNYYSVIGKADVEKKIAALKRYGSEMREPPHPRSYENVERLSKLRGSEVCRLYAEAFVLMRGIDG